MRTILTLALLSALTQPTLALSPGQKKAVLGSTTAVPNGLVGYWRMDAADIAGATLFDRSGSGINGTLANVSTVRGAVAQAGSFNGTTSQVSFSNGGFFNFGSNNFTICFGLSLGSTAAQASVVSSLTASNYSIHFAVNTDYNGNRYTGGYLFEITNYSASNYIYFQNTNNIIPIGKWTHFCAIRTSAPTLNVYRNGIADTPTATSSTFSGSMLPWTYLELGSRADIGGWFMNGLLDDVRIYNRALSSAEVSDIYASFVSGHQ
jgi:hypothetical protein